MLQHGGFGGRGDAVVVGNRAGVVEWSNDGWNALTGLGTGDLRAKPLGALLDRYEVDLAAISWVSQRFQAGESSELELPIREPDGGRRWLHVTLEPLRDDAGDVQHFVAVARDISEYVAEPELDVSAEDLSVIAAEAARAVAAELGDCITYDFALDRDLPPAYVDRERVAALVRHLIRRGRGAIADMWGNITLSTGVVGVGSEPLYRGDPVRGLPVGPYLYLEVHDTGLTSADEVDARIHEPFLPARHPARGLSLPTGHQLVRELGGDIALDVERWWGSSVLLVFAG
ncbi:MAG: PAS domain-containing protein [Proteobacteria bacterium]|nr:PAS domain-containing protein [Pseudomonadota bacterium]